MSAAARPPRRAAAPHAASVPFWRELLARWCLTLLVLVAPAVYASRVLLAPDGSGPGGPLGRGAPGAPPPAWLHLAIVTTGRTFEGAAARDRPHLAAWRERSSNVRSVVAAAQCTAGNAATLWTGRWAAHHGVRSSDRALPGDAWTLAAAARRTGAATAAFLEEPFVGATRVGGFGTVVEALPVDAPALDGHLRAFLAEAGPARVVVWLHLLDPGRGGERLDAALGVLAAALDATERWDETLTLLAPLAGPGPRVPPTAPAWIGLPAPGWGGRRNDAPLALCDLTALLRDVLRLPPPSPLREEAALHGRTEEARRIVRGWDAGLDALVHGTPRVVWSTPERVLEAPRGLGGTAGELRVLHGPPAQSDELWAAYRAREAAARRGATAAVPARVPEPWPGRAGW